jgi:hypothetical protein
VIKEMEQVMENNGYKLNVWEREGMKRLYFQVETGFKNRPYEKIGHIDLKSGKICPARGHHERSFKAHLSKMGISYEEVMEKFA